MKVKLIFKGGPGSGHHGHRGSPGRGGSLPSGGGAQSGFAQWRAEQEGKGPSARRVDRMLNASRAEEKVGDDFWKRARTIFESYDKNAPARKTFTRQAQTALRKYWETGEYNEADLKAAGREIFEDLWD